MDIFSFPIYESLKRRWRRRKYQRLDGAGKRNLRVVRLGGNKRRSWRVRLIPKLRLRITWPIKIFARLRDAYMDVMLRLAGAETGTGTFGAKRIPKERVRSMKAKEFENRLILEIYKSIAASRQLYTFE